MKLSSNMIRFYKVFGMKGMIDLFSEVGFEAIDFNCDLKEFHDGTYGKDFYTEIRKYANDKGVIFGQTHAPFASSYASEELSKQRFNEIAASFETSQLLGAPCMVVHPCQQFDYSKANHEAMYEYNLNFYKKLIPYYEKSGVKIAIENINQKEKMSIISTSEMLNRIYDDLDNEAFTFCFDVGHSNILGMNVGDEIRALGSRIGCLHVHDNDGVNDLHTLPYYGTVKWNEVAQALADIDYQGTFNYEAAIFVGKVPDELLCDGARYMSSVGHSIIDKIAKLKNEK